MSHTIFRTSQDLTALHFDVADHCLVATDGRAPQSLCEEREPGTLVPFLSCCSASPFRPMWATPASDIPFHNQFQHVNIWPRPPLAAGVVFDSRWSLVSLSSS
jgi:hypothetical protein